jgi:quercetin dioxygenase-like cupin family protein
VKAVVVEPGGGHHVGNVEFLARSADTPRFNLGVITIQPHRDGPPGHVHAAEDDAFYVLEGELTFQVEDAVITKRAGELAFAPRGVAHTLANHSDAPARYVLVCTPAGFERYFARMNDDPPEWALQDIPFEVERVGPQIARS